MTMLDAALEIAVEQMHPVFPCRERPNASGEKKEKSPYTRHGFKSATTDPEQIKRWWTAQPNAAIGIPAGERWDMLDVDTKSNDGTAHLPYLNRMGLLDGCVRLVSTPSGGYHLYFPAHPDTKNGVKASLGLDVRARGGYVVAPPSYVEGASHSGSYMVEEEFDGNGDPLDWPLILSALEPHDEQKNQPIQLPVAARQSNLPALREWVARRTEGERNNALFWAVCRCIDSGHDPYELVEPAAMAGLDEHEAVRTIKSALKRAGL